MRLLVQPNSTLQVASVGPRLGLPLIALWDTEERGGTSNARGRRDRFFEYEINIELWGKEAPLYETTHLCIVYHYKTRPEAHTWVLHGGRRSSRPRLYKGFEIRVSASAFHQRSDHLNEIGRERSRSTVDLSSPPGKRPNKSNDDDPEQLHHVPRVCSPGLLGDRDHLSLRERDVARL